MTEREALKMALDALEEINKLSVGENAICLPAEIDTAMDACRKVLAQPEQEPVAIVAEVHMSRYTIEWTNGPLPEGTKLYTTPPQPEPVIDKSAAVRIATSLGWEPKRTWVGLTDEEIDASKPPLSNDAVVWELAVEWAQSQLKEKNHG